MLSLKHLNIQRLFAIYVLVCLFFIISFLIVNSTHRYGLEVQIHSPTRPIQYLRSSTGKDPELNNKDYNTTQTQRSRVNMKPTYDVSVPIPFNQVQMPPLSCPNRAETEITNPEESRQYDICDSSLGCGMLNTWLEKSILMCKEEPKESKLEMLLHYLMGEQTRMRDFQSSLVCFKHNNTHLPVNTFPHTVCDSRNLVIDFTRLVHAKCLKYRPGYFCKKPTYYNYLEGALLGNCKKTEKFSMKEFSKDFGKDIFSSFQSVNDYKGTEEPTEVIDGVTIFLSREQDEHVNMFHSMTDFFATNLMLEMFQLNSSNVQVVILDDHYQGPFDFLWNATYSLRRPVKKASEFGDKMVRFERAIFQQAGYATHFLSHILDFRSGDNSMCHSKVSVVKGFSDRILKAVGIQKRVARSTDVIRVLFISRRPYSRGGVNHKFMARQISNEAEIIAKINTHPHINQTFTIETVDFAQLSLIEQIQIVHNSDFLVGYHGAGLTHTLWLPEETSAVLEIWKSAKSLSWRCFEQMTMWRGNSYDMWTNTEPRSIRVDKNGDYMTINPVRFFAVFSKSLGTLESKRKRMFANSN